VADGCQAPPLAGGNVLGGCEKRGRDPGEGFGTSRPWLGRITTPRLVLAGDRDPIVPPPNAHILARKIPSAQLELVHGAGHLLLLDQPDRCAAVFADVLDPEPES
jgi:pimeloyl-ACP methyl ester carboxylesterase